MEQQAAQGNPLAVSLLRRKKMRGEGIDPDQKARIEAGLENYEYKYLRPIDPAIEAQMEAEKRGEAPPAPTPPPEPEPAEAKPGPLDGMNIQPEYDPENADDIPF
jgi:hypothetical protein